MRLTKLYSNLTFRSRNRGLQTKLRVEFLTDFDFDEIWCVGLQSRVYAPHKVIKQSDLQVQK